MAVELVYNVPINLNRQELRNVTLQVLSAPPTSKLGLIYYDSVMDTPGHFNSLGNFVPWDPSKATITNLPNSALQNSSITIGTTAIALGETVLSLAGLNSVTATTFTGNLAGNAASATKLITPRTIAISGGATGTAEAFDGSQDITINVTAIDASKITGTMASSHISDLASTVKGYTLDSFAAPVADVSAGGYKITNVADGVADSDAVNVAQMRAAISNAAAGLTPKDAVRLATTGPLGTLSDLPIVDGKQTVAGDRVLVKDEVTGSQNGIYIAAVGAWARAPDGEQGELLTGSMMLVTDGDTNKGKQWWLTTPGPITVGTTALTFGLYNTNDGTTYGNGLTTTGQNVTVKPDTGIVVTVNGVAVDTTLMVRKVTAQLGDGAATTFNVTHNLGSTLVTVALINNATKMVEFAAITITDNNTVKVEFSAAPTANAYTLVIHG